MKTINLRIIYVIFLYWANQNLPSLVPEQNIIHSNVHDYFYNKNAIIRMQNAELSAVLLLCANWLLAVCTP